MKMLKRFGGKGFRSLAKARSRANRCRKWDPKMGQTCGLATASAYSMQSQLHIQDAPLVYTPPIGPEIVMDVHYDYAIDYTVSNYQFPNFGTAASDWSFNWVSYIYLDGSSNATVVVRGGGSEFYPVGSTANNLYSHATLTQVSTGVYQRALPDGSIELFNQADGTGRIFLTQITDPQGNSATIQYDTNFRITSITDAIGQQTTLTYASNTLSDPQYWTITQITDPFGASLQLLISL